MASDHFSRGTFLGSGNVTLGVLEHPTSATNSKVPTHPFTEKCTDMKTPYFYSVVVRHT
ncbi:hypothetical protein YSA_03461 [Pseudomonas putida ND6]|uniref:Uncharacterized protein n=1 Tax=Pseudomonas putida ND6 TaxID=231023 RepID=I3UT18_PSEPU|nr:hypothetical protein YSA_03461 [Pseudomonas putida ND6]